MKVQKFTGTNMQVALRLVSQQLGEDAVILSSRKTEAGFEVVAALDYERGQEVQEQEGQAQEVERQLQLQQELERARQLKQEQSSWTASDSRYQPDRDLYASSSEPSPTEPMRADAIADFRRGSLLQQASNKTRAQPSSLRPGALDKPADQETRKNLASERSRAELELATADLAKMSGEISELKNWLVSHGGNAWDTGRPLTWQQSQLWNRCQDLGLEPSWADQIVSRTQDTSDIDQGWQQALRLIATDIPIVKKGSLDKGGIYALVGPTGAGKTTTIGKLAARFAARRGAASVALVTIDSYRIAARDQLKSVARILGVDLYTVSPGEDLAKTLIKLEKKQLVLIDTAGLASQDPSFDVQLSMLKQASRQKYSAGRLRSLLVLPLTSQARCLQENYEHYRAAGLVGCIFTKLDECFSLGPAMSIAALTRLPVALIADGPHIPDDLHYPEVGKMVKLAEQMARMARTRWQAVEASALTQRQASSQHGVR